MEQLEIYTSSEEIRVYDILIPDEAYLTVIPVGDGFIFRDQADDMVAFFSELDNRDYISKVLTKAFNGRPEGEGLIPFYTDILFQWYTKDLDSYTQWMEGGKEG